MESFPHIRVLKPLRRKALSGLSTQGGFTLIEMLVVLAIIIIVTAIALAGQSGFNRTEALNNVAYDMGLSLRQAESYGVANVINGAGSDAGNNIPYGLIFAAGSPTSYTLFADVYPGAVDNCPLGLKPDCQPGDHEYEDPNGSGSNDEDVQEFTLNNGFSINAFCATDGSNKSCTTGVGGSPLQKLAITFSRPNAQVTIAGRDQGTNTWKTTYTFACIELYSSNQETRYVSVSSNGQILAGPQSTADPSFVCPKN